METIIQVIEWLEPTMAVFLRILGMGCILTSLVYYYAGLTEEAQYWVMLSIAFFFLQYG